MTIQSHVYRGLDGAVKKVPVELPSELGPKQVLIKITHASLCGTDVHYIPHSLALGHEGVGVVEKIGSEVTQFKVGDRAGGGYLRNVSKNLRVLQVSSNSDITIQSCGHCDYCMKGLDIYCYERDVYGEKNFNNGTFGDYCTIP
jgi:D-arabinose 1-dehydrogenase-like Zn-dependent alcohol dehydrogenase